MSIKCEIEFENSPSKVAYSGQSINGTVTVKLLEATIVRGVYLRLYGEAACKYSADLSETGDERLVPNSTEKYLDERIICFDGTSGKTRLDTGTHRFPFERLLPTLIPTSVEEKYAHVRYTASIRLNEFWDEAPIHKELFTIVKPLNLNLLPDLHEPFSTEREQTFYYSCFFPCLGESDKLKAAARIPQRGYTPGENINLELDLDNKSHTNVDFVMIQLIKETIVKSANFERKRSTHLYNESEDGFDKLKGEKKSYRVTITVPSTPATEETASSIIKFSYRLQIYVFVGTCHNHIQIDIPISIGTYPITETSRSGNQGNISEQANASSSSSGPHTPLLSKKQEADNPKPSAPYPENDPPTYEEATAINPKNSAVGFVPKYPVYRRASEL